MNYYATVSLFNGVVGLFLAIYMGLSNKKNPVYTSFAFLTLPIGLWSIIYAIWQSQTEKTAALFMVRLAMAACYYIAFTYLLFVRHVTDQAPKKRRIWPYLIAPTFFALMNFTPLMIKDVAPKLHFAYWPEPGILMHVCIWTFNFVVGYSFYLLFKAWAKSQGARRWQLRWVTLTTVFMWLGGLTNWFLWYDIPIPPFPNFSVAVCLLILAYVVIRRGLFDIDTLTEIVREAKLSAIGTLAASINHEIRNPLYIIKGLAESHLTNLDENAYQNRNEESSKTREILVKTIEQTQRAMNIMKSFAAFAKKEIRQKAELEKVNIPQTLQDILPLIRHELELDKIKLEINIQKNFSEVQADRRHLEEILFNLIVNACQAMKESEQSDGKIEISTGQNNGSLNITVEDNGPGIPQNQIGRVFESFYTTKKDGTGLGLYVTKQLVEKKRR